MSMSVSRRMSRGLNASSSRFGIPLQLDCRVLRCQRIVRLTRRLGKRLTCLPTKPRMSDWLVWSLLLLAVLSLPAALACAVFFYRTGTAYFGWFGYSLLLLISAIVAFLLGVSFGIDLACVRYPSGNLCGLFGFFVTGPLASSLAIFLVSSLITVADRGVHYR